MSDNKAATVVTGRQRDLGGFTVERILPAIGRKMVGPFIFFDHMGPADLAVGHGIDVRPHPHIGLATVTFLFAGAIMHRDSLGSQQEIRPGDVNWMTAGAGIVHSERTPAHLRRSGSKLEGIQAWVALPTQYEELAPSFHHHPAATLPEFTLAGGVRLRLLLGSAFDRESPVAVHSDIIYLDINMPAGSTLTVPAGQRELAAYLVQGRVRTAGEPQAQHSLVVGLPGQDLTLTAESTARLMLIGGKPFPESREIWWNFVSSSRERLQQAKADWAARRFPTVPGDEDEWIPLPEEEEAPLRGARAPAGTVM